MALPEQKSFSAGELSPSLWARDDLAKYHVGLKRLRNAYVQPHGPAQNRAGTSFCGEILDSTKLARLIPFEFSVSQAYVLVFSDLTMQVAKDGAFVVYPSTAYTITGATQAASCVLTVPSHGFQVGDLVRPTGIVGMTELNGNDYTVTATTTSTVTLNVDSTGFTAYTSGGTVSYAPSWAGQPVQIATPYAEGELFDLSYEQSADVVTIAHPSHPPMNLSRTNHWLWALSSIVITPGIGTPPAVTFAQASGGSGTSYTFEYSVTAVSKDTYEESLPGSDNEGGASFYFPNTTAYINVFWTPVAGAGRYRIYRKDNGSGIAGFIGEADGSTTTFRDTGIAADYADNPPQLRDPFPGADDYPSVVSYYQQRRFFASSNNNPQTIWASQSGAFDNFNVSYAVKDADAITATLASRRVNVIRHLVPMQNLLILTAGAEWVMDGGGGVPLTASSVDARPQGYRGASRVKPLVIGPNILYVQARGSMVRDLAFEWQSQSYSGAELSILARHLLEGYTVSDWTYAQVPDSLVWAVRSDGTALCLTYVKEQDVWGWSRHDTQGTIESVAAIPESGEDRTYFLVKRTVGGVEKRYVERMETRSFEDVRDAYFVDCGLSLDVPIAITGATQADPVVVTAPSHGLSDGDLVDVSDVAGMTEINDIQYAVAGATLDTFQLVDRLTGANIDGTAFSAYASGGYARKAVTSLSGLDHLEGLQVTGLANGNVISARTVSGGAITLDSAASRVHVGLAYTTDIVTMDVPDDPRRFYREKRVASVVARVDRTRGAWAGPTPDTFDGSEDVSTFSMEEAKWRTTEGWAEPTNMLTGQLEIPIQPDWESRGSIALQQRDPLPLTLLGLDFVMEGNVGA